MSGGSMDYLYLRVRDATFHTNSPEREAFRKHLMLVANALRSIEWNDSGDGDDQEVPNILACISPAASENDKLREENERLRADNERLRMALKNIAALDPDVPDALVADALRIIVAQMGEIARAALEGKP